MKTIYWHELSGGCCVSVDETTDAKYARDCFDGTDREWKEVLDEANESKTPTFFIVSSGLSGCYMRDSVFVYANRTDALHDAKNQVAEDLEALADLTAEESEDSESEEFE